nr:MAG TPA: hypothetical protein [Bacteriophage sp.]
MRSSIRPPPDCFELNFKTYHTTCNHLSCLAW